MKDFIKTRRLFFSRTGVNLGGWFIPEVWMAKDFFNGTGLGWGGSLCAMVNYSRRYAWSCPSNLSIFIEMVFIFSIFNAPYFSLAEERMAERLATWITIEDLREIKVNQSLLDTLNFLRISCRSFIYFWIDLTISLTAAYVIACTALKNSTLHYTWPSCSWGDKGGNLFWFIRPGWSNDTSIFISSAQLHSVQSYSTTMFHFWMLHVCYLNYRLNSYSAPLCSAMFSLFCATMSRTIYAVLLYSSWASTACVSLSATGTLWPIHIVNMRRVTIEHH